MSAEPQRKTAYSNDIRWRIVWLRLTREFSYQDVARSLCVSLGTVHNYIAIVIVFYYYCYYQGDHTLSRKKKCPETMTYRCMQYTQSTYVHTHTHRIGR